MRVRYFDASDDIFLGVAVYFLKQTKCFKF